MACLLSAPARAHDTWFAVQPGARAGELQLALGTGDRFPKQEFSIEPALLERQGCRFAGRAPVLMKAVRQSATALQLQAQPVAGAQRGQAAAITCWAQLQPLEIEIDAAKVQVYLDEIAAPAPLREAWREMNSRGVRWKERYSKHARLERLDRRLGGGDAAPAQPVPMLMDIVLESGLDGVRVGDEIRFQVLRDGQPLPGQAIEMRSSQSPLGLWRRTDAQGRASLRVPLPGAWLLRGTDLRLSSTVPDAWESRFVTLAFDVATATR